MEKAGKKAPDSTVAAIKELFDDGNKASDILRALEALERDGKIRHEDMVGLRTIQRYLDKWRDPSRPWRLAEADPGEVAAVLPVLAAAAEARRIVDLTVGEAGFVRKIREGAPDLRLYAVWRLAREYVRRRAAKASTTDLDLALGCATWRGEEEARRHIAIAKASGQEVVLIDPPGRIVDELSGTEQTFGWRVLGSVYLSATASIVFEMTGELSGPKTKRSQQPRRKGR